MRPQIVCHMMSSIDGRLIGERWSPHFSGKTLDEATVPYFDISLRLQAQAWMIGRKTVEIHYTQRQFEAGKAPPTARPPGRRGDLARKELFSTARATSAAWSESHIGSIRSGSGDVPARGRRGD